MVFTDNIIISKKILRNLKRSGSHKNIWLVPALQKVNLLEGELDERLDLTGEEEEEISVFSGIAQLPAGALLCLCCRFPISQHPWDPRRSLLGLQ